MTYYDVLQVIDTASPEVIQMAYKALVRKYHPDIYEGDKDFAERKMKQINEEYRVLSSPTLRKEYDRRILMAKQEASQYAYRASTNTQYSQPVQNATGYKADKPKESKKIQSRVKSFLEKRAALIIVLCLIFVPVLFALVEDAKNTHEDRNTPTVAAPRSGTILSGYEYHDGSEITVTASLYADCVVKLKTREGTTRLSFYVKAGDTVTVGVPREYLYVYFASGETWYGAEKLFGNSTSYSKDEDLLNFTTYTYEYTLKETNDGNFSEKPIDADEFN